MTRKEKALWTAAGVAAAIWVWSVWPPSYVPPKRIELPYQFYKQYEKKDDNA